MAEDYEQACVFAKAIRQYVRRRRNHTVILSVAKHLNARRDRPFAALRVTLVGRKRRGYFVMLSRSEASRRTWRETLCMSY